MSAAGLPSLHSPKRTPHLVLVGGVALGGFCRAVLAGRRDPERSPPPQPDYGLRDPDRPNWPTDPSDPFPMPPWWADVRLMEQTDADVRAKSAGCVACHTGIGDPHQQKTVRLGCTDC